MVNSRVLLTMPNYGRNRPNKRVNERREMEVLVLVVIVYFEQVYVCVCVVPAPSFERRRRVYMVVVEVGTRLAAVRRVT